MKQMRQIIQMLVSVVFLAGCSPGLEDFPDSFTFATNYYSTHPAGDSVFIAGTKTEPGIISPGWALYQSVTGAWGFSVGDGKTGFIYQPTPERQSVTEGKKRGLAFAFDTVNMEIRWWFDGKNVALYDVQGLNVSACNLGEGSQFRRPLIRYETDPPDTLRVMAWNIWHGGRETGLTEGVAREVDIIKESGADIICMVETYGSGPIIADSLGYYLYLSSSNLSIMSRFPIGKTQDLFRSFNFGGADIHLTASEIVQVHPDPVQYPGHTWSPVFREAWQDRIDYVYYKGDKLKPIAARVISTYKDRFPSDHAAVLAEFLWDSLK